MYSRAGCCTSRGPQARAWEIAVEARGLIGTREEGYWLDVPADGSRAVFGARSTLGLFGGSNPIAQLWLDGEGGLVVYTLSAPVAINDSPVYVSFQGFLAVCGIERTLDALTWVQVRILCSSNAR